MGQYFACGLRADGTVECWGRSSVSGGPFTDLFLSKYIWCGLHSDGSVDCSGQWPGALIGASTGRFITVSAGTDYTCGLRTDRTLSCWGMLTHAGGHAPQRGPFKDVSVGDSQACGVYDNGSIECWGKRPILPYNRPAGRFSSVSVGRGFSCGILAEATKSGESGEAYQALAARDNQIACWGGDWAGKSTPPRPDGYQIYTQTNLPYLRLSAESYTLVSAGRDHGCGLRTDQTIDCWGANNSGKATPPAGTFTDIAAGRNHSCGLRTDRTVLCWGSDRLGESTPPAGTYIDIAAGWYFSCGIRTDGTAVCWGVTNKIPGGRFTQISAGENHACGLRPDQTIECWGSNSHGETGKPPTRH